MSTNLPSMKSIRRWLFTTNHKDVGILYLLTSLYFFLIGGTLALLMRIQLLGPESDFLTSVAYNQAVTNHGLIMVLWFLSPFAFGFANYIVPLQIGAKDLAFPRINALSYWFYLFSGISIVLSFFYGAADVGWTLYAPLTSSKYSPFLGLNFTAVAITLFIVSITLGSVNFIVTIIKMRAPGMKFKHLPLFSWSILITVFMMLYAFPSLFAGVIMLFADRVLGTLYFSSVEGGSLLWDNVFWFFGHPEVYIVLFPGIGLVGDIIPAFTRRPLYGRKYIVLSLIIAAIISFFVWGHHMFVTGINPTVTKLFTLTTIAVSLPFDIIVIAMIESLIRSKIRLKTPFLFGVGSIMIFIVGGLTGIFLASVALDHHLRGSYWVVSHFHYVMVGGSVLALLGGLYYWFPKITGKMYHESLGQLHFALSFIGFNLLYFPMYLLTDMPRRISTYSAASGWGNLNYIISIGGFLFAFAQFLFILNLLISWKRNVPAGPNPWKSDTLEWATSSPPPDHNFDNIPIISDKGIMYSTDGKEHTDTDLHSSHLSYWPILMALSVFVAFTGLLLNQILFFIGVIIGLISLYGYGKEEFTVIEDKTEPGWPFEAVSRIKLGVWSFLASEIILFGALIGAFFFVKANSLTWPSPGEMLSIEHGAVNTFILLTSSFTAVLSLVAAKSGSRNKLLSTLFITFGLGLAFLYNKGLEWQELFAHGFNFSSGLPETTYFITTGAHGAHVIGGLVILTFIIIKTFKGKYINGDHSTIENFGLYWHLVDIIWLFIFPLFYLL